MSNFLLKIKLIYLQFLLVAVGFVTIYCTVIWLIVTRFELIALNEDLINFWLPFCLPLLAVYIFLRPRIKLLNLKTKRDNLPFLYYFAASLAITAPTVILQEYLPLATGKLTEITNISQLKDKPLTKYYSLKQHYIDKVNAVAHRHTSVSEKNNEYLTYYFYLACPILNKDPGADTTGKYALRAPVAWLGIQYSKGLSNHLSDAEKDTIYKAFGVETYNQFKAQNYDQFVYLDRIGNNDRRKGYLAAIKTEPQYDGTNPLILEAKDEPFEQRTGDKLGWVFKAFGIGAAIWFLMIIFPKLQPSEIKKLPEYSLDQQWASFYGFISKIRLGKATPVWMIIAALNVLVFLIMVFAGLGFISFDGHDLYNWGALIRPAVVDGQWWRLLTCTFLHGGFMHLLLNMYGLFFVGIILEPIIGQAKFIIGYLACGILASLASVWWHPQTLSVGASGAIFGMYGILTALLTTNKVDASSKKFLLINNAIFVVINLVMGLAGGIDNAAHIGGLISGVVLGYIFYFFIDAPKPKRKYKRKVKSVDDTELSVEIESPQHSADL